MHCDEYKNFYSDIGVACTRSAFKLQLTVRVARAIWHHRKNPIQCIAVDTSMVRRSMH